MVDPLCFLVRDCKGEYEEDEGAPQDRAHHQIVLAVVLLLVHLQVELLAHRDDLLLWQGVIEGRVAGPEY